MKQLRIVLLLAGTALLAADASPTPITTIAPRIALVDTLTSSMIGQPRQTFLRRAQRINAHGAHPCSILAFRGTRLNEP